MPCGSVRGEDSVAEKGDEGVFSAGSEAPFLEIESQDGLQVVGFQSLYCFSEKYLEVSIISIP